MKSTNAVNRERPLADNDELLERIQHLERKVAITAQILLPACGIAAAIAGYWIVDTLLGLGHSLATFAAIGAFFAVAAILQAKWR